ncbi:hypothetical protein BO79DRAFT_237893 [Aspergillus costaricaensis CBS 115574]|uniref:Uncharacterized protein n=1 Tax=Aspergillus costaricaensis CBS 115574 TaxID=1448317 RepID=A0ACD1IEP7_9EURO|nr:hypothetical protein BO79DRAFT_237893 [Aspergillus costaricaensis CBS 115574]RAK88220.1 hypothetical protein BO79DRAFT_237893 [Aspergillus costaricaensis CBS 115574]
MLIALGEQHLHTPENGRLIRASTDLISVLLTTDGLQRLSELSMQEGICEHVQILMVVPELFNGHYNAPYSDFRRWDCIQGALWRSRKEQDSEQVDGKAYYAGYKAAMADHQHALTSPTSIILLQECIRRFVNLSSVSLEYCPAKTTGDIICLGWRRLRAQLGFHPDFKRERFSHKRVAREHDLAFTLLAKALIASGRKVKRLSTCGPHCYGVGLGRLYLTPEEWASFLSYLQGLSRLHLCHESSAISSHRQRQCDFLAAVAPSLETLRYQIGPYNSSICREPRRVPGLFQGLPFQRLRVVRLRFIELPIDSLKQFLRAVSPTLQILTLKAISLAEPDHPSDSLPQDMEEETKRHWWRLLEFIRDELNQRFFLIRKAIRIGLSFQDWMNQLRLK